MPTHQGKGVTMIYLKRAKRGCIEPRCFMAILFIAGFFLFFASAPVHSGTIALPQTGQTVCYDSIGDIIPCLGTGQDGDILAGVAWPDPRFTGYLFSCIVDNLTGLMWYANPINFSLPRVWSEAVTIPPQINQCGFADWRLPNVNELQSLINAEQTDNASWLEQQGFIFPSSAALLYWTSTSSAASQGLSAWTINIIDGSVLPADKLSTLFVWPVRGITNPPAPAVSPPAQIPRTGQTFPYSPPSFDDGFFQAGIPWPDPRFAESGDCVTDNLTGLIWSRDANLGGLRSWDSALIQTQDLTVCGFADWRLAQFKGALQPH